MAQKKFQDLNLANAFLFAVAMNDPEFCKIVLEILLGRRVDSVTVSIEHSMLFSSDSRSIRLDVYAKDGEGNNYNVEMQGENKGNLSKRSRYHQAEMDVLGLCPGEDFETLDPNYVIFICCFDPFGQNLYRYTFTNRCAESGIELGDETMKVFLSTKGRNEQEVPTGLVNFLHYVENSTDSCVEELADDVVRQLHEHINRIRKSREWERKYMKFEELLRDRYEEGEKRVLTLVAKMTEAGEVDKLPMLTDQNFLQEMYRKYGLEDEV